MQIFFAVSGFLITSTTLRRWGMLKAVNVAAFYQMRFALHRAIAGGAADDTERAPFCAGDPLHCPGEDGRARTRSGRGALTFHVNILALARLSTGQLGTFSVAIGGGDVLSIFSPDLPGPKPGKLLIALLAGFVVIIVRQGPGWRSGNEVWREYLAYLGGMDAIALGCLTALVLEKRRLSHAALRLLMIFGTAMLAFSLGCSLKAQAWGLGRSGLDMTILALGTCMLIALGAQTRWRSPRVLGPLLSLGQRSYEIYLTHMFVVLGVFSLFVAIGRPVSGVPGLFVGVVLISGVLGEIVARFCSEPINRILRERWGDGASKQGSAVERE